MFYHFHALKHKKTVAGHGLLTGSFLHFLFSPTDGIKGAITSNGYLECNTPANTASKTVNSSGFILTKGSRCIVKMSNSNTASDATLNINSTGARSLYYDGAKASSENTWKGGEILDIYFDGEIYHASGFLGNAKAFDDLESKVNKLDSVIFNGLVINWERGYYYDGNKTKQPMDTWECARIDVSNFIGKSIEFSVYTIDGGSGSAYVFFVDKNGSTVWEQKITGDTQTSAGFLFKKTIEIPLNAKNLLISNRIESGKASIIIQGEQIGNNKIDELSNNIDNLKSEIDNLNESIFDFINLTSVQANWERGYYYNNDKTKQPMNTWECAQIDVSSFIGKKIEFSVYTIQGGGGYAFLVDESGSTIWGQNITGDIQTSTDYLFKKTFEVPSNAKYLLLSNRIESGKAEIVVKSEDKNNRIDALENKINEFINNSEYNKFLDGKTVAFLGDSITEGSNATNESNKYVNVFAMLSGCISKNLGVSSTCIAANTSNGLTAKRFVTRVNSENLKDIDLLIIFGGTNDFSYDVKPIGNIFNEESITSKDRIGTKKKIPTTDNETFDGACHELIAAIRSINPAIQMVLVTPLKRGNYTSGRPSSLESNINGNYLDDFVDVIKQIGQYYSIPVLDLNGSSNMDLSNSAISSTYSSDSLHPNDKGHKFLGEMMYKFVKQNIVF